MATITKRYSWCIRHFRWACQLWPINFIRVSFFVFQMFHFYCLDLPFSESLQLEQNFKVLPEVGIRLSMRSGIRWDDWGRFKALFESVYGPLNEPIYYSNQFWSNLFIFLKFHERIQKHGKCEANLEVILLKFRFESRQTLFGLILYGFIKRMDGYDPSPRFKIQYCLVYILIPIHYFAVLSIL